MASYTLRQENLIDTDFGKPYQYCENIVYGNSIEGCIEIMYEGEEAVMVTNDENVTIYCVVCYKEAN